MLQENIELMNHAAQRDIGMDVLIVSVGHASQVNFWEQHLDKQKGRLVKKDAYIIVVEEDWLNGAGNGLGTFYAYQQACIKAKNKWGFDLLEKQRQGFSIAIYHTAGVGKRLSPLTQSEYNNKSAVNLPGFVNSNSLLTILEGVIKQTSILSTSHRGRLSVFCSDQIFIPSKPCNLNPQCHVDIFVKFVPMPSEEAWKAQGLEKYGLMTLDDQGLVHATNKQSYRAIQELIRLKKISSQKDVGLSLGSFSLSCDIVEAFLLEFSEELKSKNAKMDSDPYIWMPTTLDIETYLQMMQEHGFDPYLAEVHYHRMQAFKITFCEKYRNLDYFGMLDIGSTSCWWDFGNLKSYFENNIKIVGRDDEARIMQMFYGMTPEDSCTTDLKIKNSCLINCNILAGKIENSILINVNADNIEADNCLIIDASLSTFKGHKSLLYKVEEGGSLEMQRGEVRADVWIEGKELFKIYTNLERNGKADWAALLPKNPMSYEQLHKRLGKG